VIDSSHKAFYGAHSHMKTQTKERIKAALLALLVLAVLLALGYLETEAGLPNH